MPDQKTMRTRCLGGFSVMWVTKLLISPVKKGFFAQKPPNLARIWHFWPLLAHSVPCWWVGWWLWRAGCISQDTYLLYLITKKCTKWLDEGQLCLHTLSFARSLKFWFPIFVSQIRAWAHSPEIFDNCRQAWNPISKILHFHRNDSDDKYIDFDNNISIVRSCSCPELSLN